MPVISNQGASALVLVSKVDTTFYSTGTYTVPAGNVFRGYVYNPSSQSYKIDSTGLAAQSGSGNMGTAYVELGPGAIISGLSASTYYVRGTLYKNS